MNEVHLTNCGYCGDEVPYPCQSTRDLELCMQGARDTAGAVDADVLKSLRHRDEEAIRNIVREARMKALEDRVQNLYTIVYYTFATLVILAILAGLGANHGN